MPGNGSAPWACELHRGAGGLMLEPDGPPRWWRRASTVEDGQVISQTLARIHGLLLRVQSAAVEATLTRSEPLDDAVRWLPLMRLLLRAVFRIRIVDVVWLDSVPSERLAEASTVTCVAPRFHGESARTVVRNTKAVTRHELSHVVVHQHSSSAYAGSFLYLDRPDTDASSSRVDLRSGHLIGHRDSIAATKVGPSEALVDGIFLGGNGSFNYYHWMLEVLPKLEFLTPDDRALPLLVPEEATRVPSLALALSRAAPNQPVVRLDARGRRIERVVIYSGPRDSPLNLRSGCRSEPGDYRMRNDSVDFLREKLMNVADESDGLGDRIFLIRPKTRRLYNETEIETVCAKRGFVSIQPELLSLDEQIAAFQNARVIVGPSGAAWTNLVFTNSGTRALSWLPEEYRGFSAYSNLAQLRGVELSFMHYATSSDSSHGIYEENYTLDEREFGTILDELLAN